MADETLYKALMPDSTAMLQTEWDDEAWQEAARQLFPFLHAISKEHDDG